MKKILFIKVNPIGTKNLFLDVEEKEIENVRLKSKNRNDFELKSIGAVTIDELHVHLEDYKPTVLHISGHGGNGMLFFHDKDNYKKEVSIAKLCDFVTSYTSHLKCVFLNSCFSMAGIDDLDETFVPAIIGMKDEVPNDTAILFSKSFYSSFFGGKSILESFDSALGVVGIDGFGDEDIPVFKGNAHYNEPKDTVGHENIIKTIKAKLVSETNRILAKNKQQRRKKSYYIIASVIVFISIFLVVTSIYYNQETMYSIAGVLPLGLIKWVKDKLDGIDNSLTLLEILENEIKKFVDSLLFPPIDGADEKVTELNGQFWKIFK